VAGLKPVYLITGDDDAKIDSWRARLRRRAEEEQGPGALETLDAPPAGPADVAAALATLTFGAGERYLLADGVECWKAGDLEPLERALADMPPGTVLVLIGRGRKVVVRLTKAVEGAGGEIRDYPAPKPWELPRWCVARAQELGLELEPDAAKELVARVGARQQRLARELEKLAIAIHPDTRAGLEEVERLAAGDPAAQAYDLADALVTGDVAASLALAERLAGREDPTRLAFPLVRRLRDVHRAAELLDAGLPEAKVAGELGMPPWLAKRTVAHARKADREALERAICAFADLEVETRGGGSGGLDGETAFTLTLARAAG
jgi:DNA polymerase-3 subunit delta